MIGMPTGAAMPTRFRRAQFDESPAIVFYEVTRACDLACKHCRACAQPFAAPGELSTTQAFQLLEQLTQFPTPPMIVLTGGDPFKRADLFELIDEAKRLGLDVSLTPSATPLVTSEVIRRLAASQISRLAISIDGADAATHDEHRGVVGSFARSLEILSEARAAGISTQINTTLTPTNIDQVEAMADCFERLDITLWSVFFLVPVGRAEDLPRLTADQYEDAFARLWTEAQRRSFGIKTTEAPHYRRFAIQRQVETKASGATTLPPTYQHAGMNDGKGILFVSYQGEIYPSGFLPLLCGKFPLDNVVSTYQQSHVFQTLRDANQLEGKCGDCEFRQICGGSRARAYALTNRMMAEEPDCQYQPRSKAGDVAEQAANS